MTKSILVIGSFGTKSDELGHLINRIEGQGGTVLCMDDSVLAEAAMASRVNMTILDFHINNSAFCEAVLGQLDARVASGLVVKGGVAL